MELKHLRYFTASVEEGSLQGAAQRLNVAQPALSRRVRDLEAELGCELLVRGARGVTATPAGLALYRDAIAMLDDLSESMQRARRLGLEQDRNIRLGFAQSTSRKYGFVRDVLSHYTRRNPHTGIAFALESSAQLVSGLRSGNYDIALLYEQNPATSRVGQRLIHSERYVLAAYPSHRLATAGPLELTQLAGEKLVWLSRRDLGDGINPLTQQLKRHGIEPVIGHLVNDTAEQLDLVIAGAGICLMPASTMLIVPEGQLIFRSVPEFSMSLDFRLAWQTEPSSLDAEALLSTFHSAIDVHQAEIASGTAHWAALDGHPILGLP
ncbi:MAG: LysR family transcriptional regulator [Sphingomonadaceae bacterium]|nr:LysR family transcriptional regulator [Sphingomonadaceae bacterium]